MGVFSFCGIRMVHKKENNHAKREGYFVGKRKKSIGNAVPRSFACLGSRKPSTRKPATAASAKEKNLLLSLFPTVLLFGSSNPLWRQGRSAPVKRLLSLLREKQPTRGMCSGFFLKRAARKAEIHKTKHVTIEPSPALLCLKPR